MGSKQTHQWSELSGERLILRSSVVATVATSWGEVGGGGRRRRKALQNSVVKYSMQ